MTTIVIAFAPLLGLLIVTLAALGAWRQWLALQAGAIAPAPVASGTTATQIELAALRERVRRLEAIADGIEP